MSLIIDHCHQSLPFHFFWSTSQLANLRRCLWFDVNWCSTRHDPGKCFCWYHEKVQWHWALRWRYSQFASVEATWVCSEAVGWSGNRVRLVASYMENIAVSLSLLCCIRSLLTLFLSQSQTTNKLPIPHGNLKSYTSRSLSESMYSILHDVWWGRQRGLPAKVDFQLVQPKPFFCAPKNISVENMTALELFLHLLEKGWTMGQSSCKRKTPYKPGRSNSKRVILLFVVGCFRLSVGLVESWDSGLETREPGVEKNWFGQSSLEPYKVLISLHTYYHKSQTTKHYFLKFEVKYSSLATCNSICGKLWCYLYFSPFLLPTVPIELDEVGLIISICMFF